jgi:hypothetical protein
MASTRLGVRLPGNRVDSRSPMALTVCDAPPHKAEVRFTRIPTGQQIRADHRRDRPPVPG